MSVEIGDKAPEFALENQYGQIVRLSDFAGFKLVLFSFPRAGTPHCTTHACAYRDAYREFQTAGALVLGITSNDTSMLRDWRAEHEFPYDLLSDPDHDVLDELGAWGYDVAGLIKLPVAERCYWVIDEDGTVIDMQIGVDPVEGVEKSLAFVEEAAGESAGMT